MTDEQRQADLQLLAELAAGEHAAIVQYMIHRFYSGEGEIGCEIEEVARREMVHWKWLNERIVQLGGSPALERGEMMIGGPSLADMIRKDVELEEHCIQEYTVAIERTSNEVLKRQFRMHLADEQRHRETFMELLREAEELQDSGEAPHTPTEQEESFIRMLNGNVGHEYGAVLQYLHQSHATKDIEVSRATLNAAIDEMKHISWFADAVVELGGDPVMEPAEVVRADTDEGRMQANIQDEAHARQMYAEQIARFQEAGREDLAELVTFVRDQETFHLEDFQHLLEQVKEAGDIQASEEEVKKLRLTVGSLFGEPQGH